MIVVRAPLRISFVGGGTDLPDFYRRYPGQVISSAIDKYVYVVINRTPMIDKISARYSISETVDHPDALRHSRIREALKHLGIKSGLEIASFANMPAKTGLGSSSSFSVALMKALHAFLGKKLDARESAEAAAYLEMELLKEPIGPQDQYASAFGGFNRIRFNSDDTVDVEPVLLDFKKRFLLENHLLVFFTGLTRDTSSVLHEQKRNVNDDDKFETMKQMADSVPQFVSYLENGQMQKMGEMLHEGWQRKRSLASNLSNAVIDNLYSTGLKNGAWGGKLLGAGAGGCLMFIAPPGSHPAIRLAMKKTAEQNRLNEFREIPVHFVQSGAEILYHGDGQPSAFA
ncbi:MAG: GHMP kinase [Patescibacteria group bacterium]